ncbi:hypothetical protein BH23BAC3_BH23BAC3_13990 [soil metagenome]
MKTGAIRIGGTANDSYPPEIGKCGFNQTDSMRNLLLFDI